MYYLYYAPLALTVLGGIALLVAWRRDKSYLPAWALLVLAYAGMTAWAVREDRYGWALADLAVLLYFTYRLAKELRFRIDAWVLPRYAEKWRARKAAEETEGDA